MSGPIEDIAPDATWEALSRDPKAQLVDVRTDAEWNFVGLPDLGPLGKEPHLIPWQVYPTMALNAGFVQGLRQRGITQDTPLYFLCRSGARSYAAAQAAQEAGFQACFNVADGFEGPVGPDGHRGQVSGWKASGLPWRQR